jgi:LmbE family N-acetylglucosaminyl deacetylase
MEEQLRGTSLGMMRVDLGKASSEPLTILCLGAHSDDIEIGCGGSILELTRRYPAAEVHWVVFSAIGIREGEARQAAEMFAGKQLREPIFKSFPDGFLPFVGTSVKEFFESELKLLHPDVIFTHNAQDAHQDHRLLSDLTRNTFRDHLILEYEIPKYDGDLGRPMVFMPLEREMCEKKVRYIVDAFPSQHTKRWFEESTFMALMRIRGMECNASSGYAEAFYCRKVVL